MRRYRSSGGSGSIAVRWNLGHRLFINNTEGIARARERERERERAKFSWARCSIALSRILFDFQCVSLQASRCPRVAPGILILRVISKARVVSVYRCYPFFFSRDMFIQVYVWEYRTRVIFEMTTDGCMCVLERKCS